MTFGIRPTGPDPQFSYIQPAYDDGVRVGKLRVYPVVGFEAKPEDGRTRELYESGTSFWNSGVFLWQRGVIHDAIERYTPLFTLLEPAYRSELALRAAYDRIAPISIDEAILTGAARDGTVLTAPLEVGWLDLSGNGRSTRRPSLRPSGPSAPFGMSSGRLRRSSCLRPLADRLELLLELLDVLLGDEVGRDDGVARAVDRTDQLVELDLGGLALAVGRRLDDEDHEEGDDRGGRVDHELPRVGEVEERPRDEPRDDHGCGKQQRVRRAGRVRDTCGDVQERITHGARTIGPRCASGCCGHLSVAAAM